VSESPRIPWRTLPDVPLLVHSFHTEASHYDSGAFSVVEAFRLDSGEQVTLTCGGRRVLEQLEHLHCDEELDRHPVWLVEIDCGRRPFLWLECDLTVRVVVRERPHHVTVFHVRGGRVIRFDWIRQRERARAHARGNRRLSGVLVRTSHSGRRLDDLSASRLWETVDASCSWTYATVLLGRLPEGHGETAPANRYRRTPRGRGRRGRSGADRALAGMRARCCVGRDHRRRDGVLPDLQLPEVRRVNGPTYKRTVELRDGTRVQWFVVGDAEGADAAAAVDELIAAARYERKSLRRLSDAATIIARLGITVEARSRVAAILVEEELDELDRSLLRGLLDGLAEGGPDA
jgi:hypothetical protein